MSAEGLGGSVTHAFAGIGVNDIAAARDWYERLLGRPPDRLPTEREAVWQLTETALLYVVQDSFRAGAGLVTLAVHDLGVRLEELRKSRIEPTRTFDGSPPRAELRDPDGNRITIFEARPPR